jgi:hypothetical protein
MRKSLTVAMAALTLGGTIAATAAPAQARPHGYYNNGYYGHHHGNDAGVAVAAGVVGLALGAAIASNNRPHAYSSGYYAPSYASGPYYSERYYEPRYVQRTCESERWVWDPYIQDRVLVRSRYRC